MQVHVVTIHGCAGAESAAHWLKGFIVNEDDTWPLMENLLAHWALVSILMHSSRALVSIGLHSADEQKLNHKVPSPEQSFCFAVEASAPETAIQLKQQ